jgi:hypothetical protein
MCGVIDDGTRQRKRQSSTGEDLDVLLKYHHSMQEKIADDMLSLARNLKEQTLLANTIIRKDVKVNIKCPYLWLPHFKYLLQGDVYYVKLNCIINFTI